MTQKLLKSLLEYRSETGVFIWKVKSANRIRIGDIAGHKRSDGYITIRIDGKHHQAHRLAWLYEYGVMPDYIDHLNQNPSDNRVANLRNVEHAVNAKNRCLSSNNTTGYPGVGYDKTRNVWRVRINIDGKRKTIGSFADKADAIACRKQAEQKNGYYKNHGRIKHG